jgi:hypothetical protein
MVRFVAGFLILGGVMAALSIRVAAADEPAKTPPKEEAFTKLYNGKDLTGWEVQNGKIEAWKAEGELLVCDGEGGGWLRTKEMYSDFVLRIEWKIGKKTAAWPAISMATRPTPARKRFDDGDE